MSPRAIVLLVLACSALSALVAVVASRTLDVDAPAPITTSTANPREAATQNEVARRVYEQASQAVVHVTATVKSEPDFLGNSRSGVATGSGFVIDGSGHVVTNAHVVDGASEVRVSFPGEAEYETAIVGIDASSDLAVLRIKASKTRLGSLKKLQFADSEKARVGDFVIAIGNPLSLDYTATTGIVSALDRQISSPNGFVIDNVLQTDAAINQGNSGGPLLDSNANVLGVNSQIATSGSSSGSIGIGFAIPASTVSDIAGQLIKSGVVRRAYLGLSGFELTKGLAQALDAPVTGGVMLMQVTEGAPADRAGLRAGDTEVSIGGQPFLLGGDIVTRIGDTNVRQMSDISTAITKLDPGDRITITFYRGDDRRTVTVTLAARPADR